MAKRLRRPLRLGTTLIAGNTDELVVTIDQHFEYSRLIEDITDVQALNSLRHFYTEDAGYALATKVDSAIIAESAGFTTRRALLLMVWLTSLGHDCL